MYPIWRSGAFHTATDTDLGLSLWQDKGLKWHPPFSCPAFLVNCSQTLGSICI